MGQVDGNLLTVGAPTRRQPDEQLVPIDIM
jgi:hypothetical protein